MHQHPLSGLHIRQYGQPVPRRQEHHRHTGGLHRRPPRRHRGHQPRVDHRLRTHHPQQPQHGIAHGQALDPGADLDDDPRALGPQLPTAGIHPQRHQHIPEVHAHRSHRHPHLPSGQLHRPGRGHHHVLQRAPTAGSQLPPVSRQLQHRPRPHRGQPGRVHHTGTHNQLRLTTTNYRCSIERSIRIYQHNATRMLGLRRAHQPPHRRTGQIGDFLTGQTHRPMSQHDQDPRTIASQPRLQHPQHLMSGRIHRTHHTVSCRTWFPHHYVIINIVAPHRHRRPRDFIQRPTATSSRRHRRRQRLCRDRTNHQLAHRQDWQARTVSQVHRHRPGSSRRYPDPNPRCPGSVQTDPLPRKRQHRRVPALSNPQRMQRRIQHRRMNAKPSHRHTFTDGYLGKDLLIPPPQRTQTPKCRPILITPTLQHLIHITGIQHRSPRRRPD